MAATTRAITPTRTGPFSSTNAGPHTPTSISSASQPVGASSDKAPGVTKLPGPFTPGLAAAPSAGLRAALSPKVLRVGMSPEYSPRPLTGAAAMADERRLREQQAREDSRQMSPNPATTAISALLGGAGPGMSSAKDAPAAATTMSEPLARVAKSITTSDTSSTNEAQTSPVSLSSFGSIDTTTAPTATAPGVATSGPPNPELVAAPGTSTHSGSLVVSSGGEVPSNRAFTFPAPGPLDQDSRGPARVMSLPMSGYAQNSPKSPSAKRHKCPYCSTDFTRHHNLKSHLLTHSQEKPYECTTCQARFRRLHDLKRHTKLHTGERPHICNKCGRKFARGDALARHNKGQGGCAGRRSSFGVDDEGIEGRASGEGMEGLEYNHSETAEPDRMDEDDEPLDGRRRSEPSTKAHEARPTSLTSPYRQHSSTYPPLGGNLLRSSVGSMYPPGHSPGNSSTATPSRDQSTNLSPRNTGSSISSIHFNAQPSLFAHGGMTESPKPLSPGQVEPHHRPGISEIANLPGSRPLHHQQHAHGTGRGSPAMGLPPPPAGSGMPQLPPIISQSDLRLPPQASKGPASHTPGPSMLHQQLTGPGNGSNPGSASSHGPSSGASIREILGGREGDLWGYVRDLESRMARMQDDYESRIGRLQDEVTSLRSQLQHQGR